MKREGFDYMEMARYAWLGDKAGLTSGVEEVRKLLPVQNSNRKEGPGFKNKEVQGPTKHTEVSWTFMTKSCFVNPSNEVNLQWKTTSKY